MAKDGLRTISLAYKDYVPRELVTLGGVIYLLIAGLGSNTVSRWWSGHAMLP